MSKKEIFKLQNGSDIRGVACSGVSGEEINLTAEVAYKIGAAFITWLSIKTSKSADCIKIGIGRDSRITGQELLLAVLEGVKSTGAKITDCEMATTPAMFMSCIFPETDFDGAIMITASHLPFNRNGIKFFDKQGGLDHEDITIILEMAENVIFDKSINSLNSCSSDNESNMVAKTTTYNLIDRYSQHLISTIKNSLEKNNEKPLAGLKIVVDSGNGASGFFVSKILKPLGADTTGSQFLEPDGMFPNHIPNPENKEAMKAIQNATVTNNADLGLIFDTDVDRMSAVLPDGSSINRDSIIAIIAAILAPDYPGSTIVTDSVTSDRLTFFLEKELKLKHLRFMRGYKNVINKQIELNQSGEVCPLAMETSGHGALKENYYLDDGAYLAVKLIIALAKAKKEGKTLASLIEKMPKAIEGEEKEFRLKILTEDFESYGKSVLKEFKTKAQQKNFILPKSYEGIRISFNSPDVKGWLLLRLSLHDPVMPLNIEGERSGDAEKIKAIAKELLKDFDQLSELN